MAKWRALHKEISTSGQVNQLTEFEKLLFTWMIAHADDWGVLTGDPEEVKLKVMPGTDRELQEISAALGQIAEVGLIWLYETDEGEPLVQFRKWDDFQPIRKDRRLPPTKLLYSDCVPGKDRKSQARTGHTILDNTMPDKTISSPKKKPRKNPDTPHHRVVAGYVERISKGYAKRHAGKFAGDMKAIKQMLERGHSEKTILDYWDNEKAGWWSTRHLSMRKIDENIDDHVKAGGKRGSHKQGGGDYDNTHDRAAARRQAAGR